MLFNSSDFSNVTGISDKVVTGMDRFDWIAI